MKRIEAFHTVVHTGKWVLKQHGRRVAVSASPAAVVCTADDDDDMPLLITLTEGDGGLKFLDEAPPRVELESVGLD